MTAEIRPLALGIPHDQDRIFLSTIEDPATGESFYRPVGGGIEVGESSRDTVQREFREELDVIVEPGSFLGTIENHFTFGGEENHELVYVFQTSSPPELLDELPVEGVDDGGITYRADWYHIKDLQTSTHPVYPQGLLKLLTTATTHIDNNNASRGL